MGWGCHPHALTPTPQPAELEYPFLCVITFDLFGTEGPYQ